MHRRHLPSGIGASARVTQTRPVHHQPPIRRTLLTLSKGVAQEDAAEPASSSKCESTVSRRALLGCTLAWTCSGVVIANTSPAWAEEEGGKDAPANQFIYEFASDVSPHLRAKEYYSIIVTTRRQCWADIAQCIQSKNYTKLALLPTQAPFSDLRAAALYCPWALLQSDDYAAATDCRKSYVDFDVHVQDLKQIAEAAALDGANPEQVQQSFILLNASLEMFLSSIPARYTV